MSTEDKDVAKVLKYYRKKRERDEARVLVRREVHLRRMRRNQGRTPA